MNKEHYYKLWQYKSEGELVLLFDNNTKDFIKQLKEDNFFENIFYYNFNVLLERMLKYSKYSQEDINRFLILSYSLNNYAALKELIPYWKEDNSKQSFLYYYCNKSDFTFDKELIDKIKQIKITNKQINSLNYLLEEKIEYGEKNGFYLTSVIFWKDIFNVMKITNQYNKLEYKLPTKENKEKIIKTKL